MRGEDDMGTQAAGEHADPQTRPSDATSPVGPTASSGADPGHVERLLGTALRALERPMDRAAVEIPVPDESTDQALQRLQSLVDGSSDFISRHAADGTYLYASPACRDLLGWEPTELVGTSAYAYFHPDDLAAITESHAGVIATANLMTVRYRIRRKDGTYTWFETTSHTLRDPDSGEVVEIQTHSRDVSDRVEEALEREALLERLREVNRRLEEFAETAAHDLRKPLAIGVMAADMLSGDIDLPDEQRRLVAARLRSTMNNAAAMIEDLLARARHTVDHSDAVTSCQQTVAWARDLLADDLAEVGGTIEVDDHLPSIRVGEQALRQVVLNLLTNAIRYRSPDRPLRIAVRGHAGADETVLEVVDNGRGIPPAEREHVLDRGTRLVGTGDVTGSGIGLDTVRQIATEHRGRVEVTDADLGGVTLRLIVPTRPPPADA